VSDARLKGTVILRDSGGITRRSAEALGALIGAEGLHGGVRAIEFNGYDNDGTTIIYFRDGCLAILTGFSVGYVGEGSVGFVKLLSELLQRTDLTIDVVSRWRRDGVYLVLPEVAAAVYTTRLSAPESSRHPIPLARFAGCCDSEFDAEVW